MKTDELRRLLVEATPGPWTHRLNHKPYRIVVFGSRKAYEAGLTTSDIEPADAALIAAAVNALPALLDVIEAARANQEAWAGRGHIGRPHDDLMHVVAKHDDTCMRTWDDDCSACAGAQYGTDVELNDALARLDAAE